MEPQSIPYDHTPFDKSVTIQDNFPRILRPLDSEVNMLDSKIDVNNLSDPLDFELIKSEFLRIYYDDHHLIYNRILKYFERMLEAGKVIDRNG